MVDELAFVQAIATNPDDDGPRLMFADFLEERGDPASIVRAEFIRVQCAIAQQQSSSDMLDRLCEREMNLLEANWRLWLRPVCQALGEPLPVASQRSASGAGPPERYTLQWLEAKRQTHMVSQPWTGRETAHFFAGQFRRGFLSHAALVHKLYKGPQHAARLVERTPIDGLTLIQYPFRELGATLAASQPKNLRSLEFVFPEHEGVAALAHERELSPLRELMIRSARDSSDVAAALTPGAVFENLRVLILNSCDMEVESLWNLARLPWVAQLERVDFIHCGLTDRHAQILVQHWPDTQLKHFDLSSNRFTRQGWKLLYDRFSVVMSSSIAQRPWPERFYL
jgi:uncharacterized protein (TIGR02996 family)